MRCRPSEVLRMEDEFVAYAFDSAVVRWGVSFEAALSNAGHDAKDAKAAERAQSRVLRNWLPETKKYADPRSRDQRV